RSVGSRTGGLVAGPNARSLARSRAVLRGPETRKALEGVRKGERVGVTDIARNGLDLALGSDQLVCGPGNTHGSELTPRAAPEVLPAQTPQVFGADVRQPCQLFEHPRPAEIGEHRTPHAVQSWLPLPGVDNARHIALNDIDPYGAGTRVATSVDFMVEAAHRVFEGTSVEACQRGAHGARQRPGGAWHEPNPAQLPACCRQAVKGMQYMGGSEARKSRRVRRPAPIEQGLPFPTQAHLHESAAQMGA